MKPFEPPPLLPYGKITTYHYGYSICTIHMCYQYLLRTKRTDRRYFYILAFCGAFDVPRGFAPDYYTIPVSLHRKRTLERVRLRYEPTGVDEMKCRYGHKRDYPRISEARSRSLGPERKRTYCMRRTLASRPGNSKIKMTPTSRRDGVRNCAPLAT